MYAFSLASCPRVLILCSRLPVLSPTVVAYLKTHRIYSYGYPCARTLPFRYFFERRVRNNRSTSLISDLWKKKLLEQQRTHVLKGSHCNVKNIKDYFEQIWSTFVNEKHDEDDEDDASKSFEDRCQQAFQQANIDIKKTLVADKESNALSRRPSKKSNGTTVGPPAQLMDTDEIVQQLNHLLHAIGHVKEQISAANPSQILKMNNHIQQSSDGKSLIPMPPLYA